GDGGRDACGRRAPSQLERGPRRLRRNEADRDRRSVHGDEGADRRLLGDPGGVGGGGDRLGVARAVRGWAGRGAPGARAVGFPGRRVPSGGGRARGSAPRAGAAEFAQAVARSPGRATQRVQLVSRDDTSVRSSSSSERRPWSTTRRSSATSQQSQYGASG